MRIGIFTNCYLPLVNGVVGAVSLLRRGFMEAGHQVYIFAPEFDDYVDLEPGIYRYPAIDLTRRVKYPVAIPFAPKINRVLPGLNLDIIHCHHPFVLGVEGLKAARRLGIPSVYTFHTQYDQYNHYIPLPGRLVSAFTVRRVRNFCEKAGEITTPAESARQILIRYGVNRKITVIPNPIDLTRFTMTESLRKSKAGALRNRYNLGDSKLLVNVGRVAPEKNLPLLLRAFQTMLQQSPSQALRLMIIGDGPVLEDLKQLAAALHISSEVCFTGLVPPAEISDYLAAADLMVMTSTTEVKPLAQLEALAAGVPIIAVAAPGANDTIVPGENGFLVAEDAAAISRAVLDLIFDPLKLENFRAAARHSANRYAYPTVAGEYLELFEKAKGERRKA